jgi:hypothetical protein
MSADASTRPDLQGAPEEQREVTDEDLRLLSEYTGSKDLDALRQHVYRVQKRAKESVGTAPVILLRGSDTVRWASES